MSSRATRATKRAADVLQTPVTPSKRARKPQLELPPTPETPTLLESIVLKTPSPPTPALPLAVHPPTSDPAVELVHVPLTFKLADARKHLCTVDPRFVPFFEQMKCRPFEDVENDPDAGLVNPFRSLCSSILGQQISWLAARAVQHKFLRIYDPTLPEKYDPQAPPPPFPTPAAVAATSMTDLRNAGLSQRKAEYIQDLASRFADGRLDPEKLVRMTDEEVMEALIQVRGIGKWTVEMFQIFTLKRPDILPPGDLGIQKGLVRWYTQVSPAIAERKLKSQGRKKPEDSLATPPATPGRTASIVDESPATPSTANLPPLPPSETLTPGVLRTRLTKKIKGNIYLSPKECEELTEAWKPYRSVGIFYLWSITEGDSS